MRDFDTIILELKQLNNDDDLQKYLLALSAETNDIKLIPTVLKRLTAENRLAYIRQEDSGATEYGNITNAEFKIINYIIYCDIYLEHLIASQYSHPTYSPELTKTKINIIETARAILLDKPESEATLQEFYDHLVCYQNDLAKRRDTQFTSFLKSVRLTWLVDYAYNSFFVKTDGKILFEKITSVSIAKTIDKQEQDNLPKL
ncbi:MAG: hypothetical protein P1U36_05635 [Legionellaceae bacterium]|nr:hypothetical protein [Legionellaceae bacterium]